MKWLKHKSIVWSWAISYALLLAFAMFAISVICIATYNIVKKTANEFNDYTFNQMKAEIAEINTELEEVCTNIRFNKNLSDAFRNEKLNSAKLPYNYMMIRKDMEQYVFESNNISFCYVYFLDNDTVVSSSTIDNSKDFFLNQHSNLDFTYEQWYEDMHSNDVGEIKLVKDKVGNFALMKRYHNLSRNIVIVAGCDNNVIKSMQQRIQTSDNVKFLITKDDVVLYESGKETLAEGTHVAGIATEEQSVRLNGKKYIVNLTVAFGSNMNISIISPQNEYGGVLLVIRNVMAVGIIFILLGCAVLTFILIKRQYQPVRNILSLFDSNTGRGVNELAYIEKKLESDLSEHKRRRIDELLLRVISGKTKEETELQTILKECGINLCSDNFLVMVCAPLNIGELMHDNSISMEEKREITSFIFKNVLEELALRVGLGFVFEKDDNVICLFNCRNEADCIDEIYTIAAETQTVMAEEFYLKFNAALGGVHRGRQGVSKSYNEALYALELLDFEQGTGDIIRYSPSGDNGVTLLYLPQDEQQLINCVEQGDTDRAISFVNHLFDEKLSKANHIKTKFVMNSLVNTLLKLNNRIVPDNEDAIGIMELLHCDDIGEFRGRTERAVQMLCSYVKEHEDNGGDEVIERIKEYINAHFSDSSLSITLVGEYFGVDAKQLSRQYSNLTGERMIDTINKRRIEAAKDFLKADEVLSVESIAERSGFGTVRNFMRVFKKLEGITPSQFRNTIE